MADTQPTPVEDESTRFGPQDRKRWILVHHPDLQDDGVNSRIHAAAWPRHAAAGFRLVDDDPDGVAQRDAQDDAAVLPVGDPTTAGGRQAPVRPRPTSGPADPPAGQ